jgi:hypothetical protein
MTSTLPIGTLGSVAPLLATNLYQANPDRNHKLWTNDNGYVPLVVKISRSFPHSLLFTGFVTK